MSSIPDQVLAAVKPGHTLTEHSGALIPRWVCAACGRTVFLTGNRVYGTATLFACDGLS